MSSYNAYILDIWIYGYILPIRSNCKGVAHNKKNNLFGLWRVSETFYEVRT